MIQYYEMILDQWPPEYTIRKSKRAKRLRLRISRQKGIEVVIPYYASHREADDMVHSQRNWIERQLQQIAQHNMTNNPDELPSNLSLLCIDQLWSIDFFEDNKRTRLKQHPHKLAIHGNIINAAWKALLISWLKKQAKIILTPWLNEISYETGLSYTTLNIRGQCSRWGSCSTQKAINLNYKLLFLPAHLVENVLLHELCHTAHMNHSDKFWNLMQQHNSNAIQINKEIKKAQQHLPNWLEF